MFRRSVNSSCGCLGEESEIPTRYELDEIDPGVVHDLGQPTEVGLSIGCLGWEKTSVMVPWQLLVAHCRVGWWKLNGLGNATLRAPRAHPGLGQWPTALVVDPLSNKLRNLRYVGPIVMYGINDHWEMDRFRPRYRDWVDIRALLILRNGLSRLVIKRSVGSVFRAIA